MGSSDPAQSFQLLKDVKLVWLGLEKISRTQQFLRARCFVENELTVLRQRTTNFDKQS